MKQRKGNLVNPGNHLGGRELVEALPVQVVERFEPYWLYADPNPDRSPELALRAKNRFPTLHPRVFVSRGQEAIAHTEDEDTLGITVDTVGDTLEILEARKPTQTASWQLLGRTEGGENGTRIGLQGTIIPGDSETEQSTKLLLNTFNQLAPPASSRQLTGPDPLTALIFKPERKIITRHLVQHLMESDREPQDLTLGPQSIALETQVYPLVSVQGYPDDLHSHRRDLALEIAGKVPTRQFLDCGPIGRFLVVAVVIPEERSVYLMKIAQNRTGKRRLDGMVVFKPPVPVPEYSLKSEPAAFTD